MALTQTAENIKTVWDITSTGAQTGVTIKNSSTDDGVGTALGALGIVTTFAGALTSDENLKKKFGVAGLGATIASIENNRRNAINELTPGHDDYKGYIKDKTIIAITSDVLTLVSSGILLTASATPLAIVGLVAATGLGVYGAMQSETDSDIYDTYIGLFDDIKEYISNDNTPIVSSDDNTTTIQNTIDTSELLQNQYNDFKDNSDEDIEFGDWIADTNNSINVDDFSLVGYLKELGVNQVTKENQTYTIQNGDTLWDLSKRLGITIDELIEKNPWLKDRISQDGKYALIKVGEELQIDPKWLDNLGDDALSLRIKNDYDIENYLQSQSDDINEYKKDNQRLNQYLDYMSYNPQLNKICLGYTQWKNMDFHFFQWGYFVKPGGQMRYEAIAEETYSSFDGAYTYTYYTIDGYNGSRFSTYQEAASIISRNISDFNSRFNEYKNAYNHFLNTYSTDPLALDLNHDGIINTISQEESNINFDVNGDNIKSITGWISSEDGWLVYDKNNNGKIDDINELFGNMQKDGYQELKELFDSNGDNIINKDDENFDKLQVWQDINSDGISQSSELKTLDELNITDVSVSFVNDYIENNSNVITKTSTFTQNGNEYLSGDVDLTVNKRFTQYSLDYEQNIDTLFLPWIRGYGNVLDTNVVYELDSEFKKFTKDILLSVNGNVEEFELFLKRWSGLQEIHDKYQISRDTLSLADKIWILEEFSGINQVNETIEEYYKNGENELNLQIDEKYINESFSKFFVRNYQIFSMQAYYYEEFSGSFYDVSKDKIVVDNKITLQNSLIELFNSELESEELFQIISIIKNFNDDFSLDYQYILNSVTNSEYLGKLFYETDFYIYDNGDYSVTKSNASVIYGTNLDNIFSASNENDTLIGNKGDDTLWGNEGDDTYIYNLGDGNDTIFDRGGVDTLVLNGIRRDKVIMSRNNYDLVLSLNEQNSITIQSYYSSHGNEVENIKFVFPNQAPIITEIQSKSVYEGDGVISGTILATDEDGDSLTYTTTEIIDGFILNSDGTYNFDANNEKYQSLKKGELRRFDIPVEVSDGDLSDIKNLTITITGTNDAPIIETTVESYQFKNNLTQSGIISDVTDIDADVLSYKVTTNPTHGILSINNKGEWVYDPIDIFVGSDSAIVTIDDGNGGSVSKTLNFIVEQSNIVPIANDDSGKVGEIQGEFLVNTNTLSTQALSKATSLKDGGYVITWSSYSQDGSDYGIYSQRYSANGEKVGVETQVNTYTSGRQNEQSITSLSDGGYVITWSSYGQDGHRKGIYSQRYDKNGNKMGTEIQVNTYIYYDQTSPILHL